MPYKLICLLALLGSASAEMTGFIVGGVEASIRDWPFIAFIASFKNNEPGGACGGSLISSQTVLTAAHCLDDVTDNKKDFYLYTYTILMGHREFSKSIMQRNVKDYITHEQYDPDSVPYDIGIMFLEHPVTFQRTVQKVLLMTKYMGKSLAEEKGLLVGGWGRFSAKTDGVSTTLKQLAQFVVSPRRCHQYMMEDETDLDPGVVCAGRINATEYAYSGDSGGPLARLKDQYLAGVVSYRMESHGITVYTNVAYYYNWIERTQRRMFAEQCGGDMTF